MNGTTEVIRWCPECGQKLRMASGFRGTARCPMCSHQFHADTRAKTDGQDNSGTDKTGTKHSVPARPAKAPMVSKGVGAAVTVIVVLMLVAQVGKDYVSREKLAEILSGIVNSLPDARWVLMGSDAPVETQPRAFVEARDHFRKGDLRSAERLLRQALEEDPSLAVARVYLQEILYRRSTYPSAH